MRKKIFFIWISFVFITILYTSCSVEKRHYMAGYNVDWKSNKNLTANHEVKNEQQATASNAKQLKTEPQNQFIEPVFHQAIAEKSVIQENPEFAYTNNIKKSEFKNSHEILTVISKAQLLSNIYTSKKTLALFASQQQSCREGGIQIVALLLCLLLGFLGVHSFYLGNIKKGVIQLILLIGGLISVMFGFEYPVLFILGIWIIYALLIWVLVDLIRLIFGDLGPGW